MSNYLLGASHAAIACFLVYSLCLPYQNAPVPSYKPYAVVYQADCYIDGIDGGEFSVMPVKLSDLITIEYESPGP